MVRIRSMRGARTIECDCGTLINIDKLLEWNKEHPHENVPDNFKGVVKPSNNTSGEYND